MNDKYTGHMICLFYQSTWMSIPV